MARPHPRLAAALWLAALALLVGVSAHGDDRPTEIPYAKPGEIPMLDPSYRMQSHKVVIIKANELSPRLVTLDEGQLVAWISYAPVASEIVFEREVARSMICHNLVNFAIRDDELRSAPINAGEFASFCELKPGRYRYKVIRTAGDMTAIGGARRLAGEIVVGNPSD